MKPNRIRMELLVLMSLVVWDGSVGTTGVLAMSEPPLITLVREGQAECAIVVGREDPAVSVYTMSRDNLTQGLPANTLIFAAHDLADTLHEMAGIWNPAKQIPVVNDSAQARAKYRILLGSAAIEAYGLQAEAAALPYPAYVYRAVSNDLLIFGSSSKGAANGVYGFLQDQLGMRWFGPQDLFRVVPRQTNIVVGALDIKVAPSFLGRIMNIEARIENPTYTWRRRMRMSESVDQQEPFINTSHFMYRIFPATQYYTNHPEYYAMRSGRRMNASADLGWAICYSNTNVVEIAAAAAKAHFGANARHQSFSLGINDCMAYCECEACAKLQPPRTFQGQRVASDMYFHFVNEVARRVGKEFPDRYLGVIAYNDVTAPPVGGVESNVHVGIVNDVSEYYDATYRSKDEDLVKAWQAKGITLGFYYYTGLAKLVPAYFSRMLAGVLKDKHRRGFTAVECEVYPGWPWNGPQAYMQARLWWDINLDTDKLLDEYFDSLFGPAADPMRKLYALFEEIHLRPRGGGFLYEHYKYQQFRPYTAADLAQMRALLAAAHAAIPGLGTGNGGRDGKQGQRVAYVSNGLKVFLDMLEGKVLTERLAAGMATPRSNVAVLERLEDIERGMALMERHTALYRETILADPYQAGRYTHDTCTPVRNQWQQGLGNVIGLALADLYRMDTNQSSDQARVNARLAGLVADWTRDESLSMMFKIHAKLVSFGPNLVLNPGFELSQATGTPNPPHLEWLTTTAPDWAAWQMIPGQGNFGVTESEMQEGRRSGCMTGIGDGCFITRVPDVKAGDSYYLEAYVKNTAHTVQENKPSVKLEARWLDSQNRWTQGASHVATQELDRWVKLQHVVKIPEGAATAVILVHVNNLEAGKKVYLDAVSFRKIQ